MTLPFWQKYLRETNKYKSLILSIITNATLITDKNFKNIKKYNTVNTVISFDGAAKEVYEKIRGTGHYDNVVNNIKKLKAVSKEISLNFSIMKKILGLPNLLEFFTRHEIEFFYNL